MLPKILDAAAGAEERLMSNNGPRFQARNDNWRWFVTDTTKHPNDPDRRVCWTRDDEPTTAILIADALNSLAMVR